MKSLIRSLSVLLLGMTLSSAASLTAFQAKALAEKQIPEQARGKLIKIVGPRGAIGLTPVSWRFLFWDPTAEQNGRAVTVTGSSVTEIKEGYVELDSLRLAAYKDDEVIAPAHLKLDSNQALDIVARSAQLKDVKLSTVTFLLAKGKGDLIPYWKLRFFADKEGKEADIGYAKVSAETGQIFEMKIDLDKLQKK